MLGPKECATTLSLHFFILPELSQQSFLINVNFSGLSFQIRVDMIATVSKHCVFFASLNKVLKKELTLSRLIIISRITIRLYSLAVLETQLKNT